MLLPCTTVVEADPAPESAFDAVVADFGSALSALAVGAAALDEVVDELVVDELVVDEPVVDELVVDGLDALDVEAGAETPDPKEIKVGDCVELPAKATGVVTDGLCAAGVN